MDRVQYESLIIQEILNLNSRKELDLRPWYQRRSVWINTQKAYLINTLLEKKPIPAIYMRHSVDVEQGKSIKEIVDGQQRTTAIIEFVSDAFTVNHPSHKKRVKYSQLSTKQKEDFLLTSVPVGYLLGASEADVIDIFARINSVSKTLNSQEKRNARFSGEMKQFCLQESVKRLSFWRNYGIFSDNDIARMVEVEFVSDLVVNLLRGLSDFKPKSIDDMYAKNDESFPEEGVIQTRLDRIFDILINFNPTAIQSTIFKRQPMLFSLMLVIDEKKQIKATDKLASTLIEIDAKFKDESYLEKADKSFLEFVAASTSTTQRIRQRRVRHDYLVSVLA